MTKDLRQAGRLVQAMNTAIAHVRAMPPASAYGPPSVGYPPPPPSQLQIIVERQVVVMHCKYCQSLTPADLSACKSCGGQLR
ncbi:MAG: hypothetical protein KF819_26830 [Labilithrix sp.]|nr:hypothetical protein [Labilithrix sp.]